MILPTKHARSSLTFPQRNNSVRAELNLIASAILQIPSPLILFERISRLQWKFYISIELNKSILPAKS
jgi:hypothetical protein